MGDTETDSPMTDDKLKEKISDLFENFAHQFISELHIRHDDFDPEVAFSVDLQDRFVVKARSEPKLILRMTKHKKYQKIHPISASLP